jgi:hypothetical protein
MKHVFSAKPRYCIAFKPGIIVVRCPQCGRPHEEYFGPLDRDERAAEVEMLRRELAAAAAIIVARGDVPKSGLPPARRPPDLATERRPHARR